MNINTAVEIVLDTNVVVGYLKEHLGEEPDAGSRSAIEAIRERDSHFIRISKAIRKEIEDHFDKEGKPGYWLLTGFFAPLEYTGKLKKIEYNQEEVTLYVSLPHEKDFDVAQTAVAVRNRYRKLPVFLLTKNLRHFDPEEWMDKHHVSVMSPEDYVADP